MINNENTRVCIYVHESVDDAKGERECVVRVCVADLVVVAASNALQHPQTVIIVAAACCCCCCCRIRLLIFIYLCAHKLHRFYVYLYRCIGTRVYTYVRARARARDSQQNWSDTRAPCKPPLSTSTERL